MPGSCIAFFITRPIACSAEVISRDAIFRPFSRWAIENAWSTIESLVWAYSSESTENRFLVDAMKKNSGRVQTSILDFGHFLLSAQRMN